MLLLYLTVDNVKVNNYGPRDRGTYAPAIRMLS